MDQEVQLIRSGDWGDLKRLYSKRLGSHWELAWLYLTKLNDKKRAVSEFKQSIRDPHFEEASYLMLRALGAKPGAVNVITPASLRFFDAYEKGDLRPLSYFILQDSLHHKYAENLLARVFFKDGKVTEEPLRNLSQVVGLSSAAHLRLGQIWDFRLKNISEAQKHYKVFLKNAWTLKALEEARRSFVDDEMARRIRYAFAEKDGVTLKRMYKALAAKAKKSSEAEVSAPIQKSFLNMIRLESDQVTKNMLGYPFWKDFEFSPEGMLCLRRGLYGDEQSELPPFVTRWADYFSETELDFKKLPIDLESNSLAMMQIAVESNQISLSDALLRFPNEERFLFLWSVRNSSELGADSRRWPENEKESSGVRKNLERAFERSSNKMLWFDRLRDLGCSQDFYEYALTELDVPLSWVLEDIEKNFLDCSPAVRVYIRERISVVTPGISSEKELNVLQLKKLFQLLTPAEAQSAMVSRFVLGEIPVELLDLETLDLLWDAQTQVSKAVFQKWFGSVLQHIQSEMKLNFHDRFWLWIEESWKLDPKYLDTFSADKVGSQDFPYLEFLKGCQMHSRVDLMISSLFGIKDQGLKADYLQYLIEISNDSRLTQLIDSLSVSHVRQHLRALYSEKQKHWKSAIEHLENEIEETPLLNRRPEALKKIFELSEFLTNEEIEIFIENKAEKMIAQLKSYAGLQVDDLQRLANLAQRVGKWSKAWAWMLQAWWIGDNFTKERLLPSFLDITFKARKIEETQRLLVDAFFVQDISFELADRIMMALLGKTSVFKLKHLRREFVDRASQLAPLKEEILRKRAEYDYRAVVLWESFYGSPLEESAAPFSWSRKLNRSLWGLTELMSDSHSLGNFESYVNVLALEDAASEVHPALEDSQRLFLKVSKSFGMKSLKPKLLLRSDLKSAFRISFEPATLEMNLDFFKALDQETSEAIFVGFLQVVEDRRRGLYEDRRLIERFFQGTLLASTPIAKIIRLAVWLAIWEKMAKPEVLKSKPEELTQKIEFIRDLLSFYLGPEFLRKQKEMGIIISEAGS